MYKELLNKGFKPIYYTNEDWFISRKDCKTRLFYKYRIETKEILNSIINTLGIFNEYFFIIENDEVVAEIETDENLNEYCIYFYNVDADNYKIPIVMLENLLNVIPNNFTFEYSE